MLDVTKVGANLTPEEQDETLRDLTFFLDEFGSTRAVRIKLKEQERDISRFRNQVWGLTTRSAENALDKQETLIINTENAVEETMEDLDFFLRTFGSTRVVRHKLETQKRYIAGLKCMVQWLQLRKVSKKIHSKAVAFRDKLLALAPQMAMEAEREENGEKGRSINSVNGSDVADVDMEEEEGGISSLFDDYGAERDVMPTEEKNGEATSSEEREQIGDEEMNNFRSHPLSNWWRVAGGAGSMDTDIGCEDCSDSGSGSDCSDGGNSRVEADDRQTLGDLWTVAEQNYRAGNSGTHEEKSALARTINKKLAKMCTMPGCCKTAQAHRLCCRHGGYRICKIDGCNRRASTLSLCRTHGGGTKCKIAGCDKFSSSGRKGYCSRHAREQGLDCGRCRVRGCSRLRAGLEYCRLHTFESDNAEARARELNEDDREVSIPAEREDAVPYQPSNESQAHHELNEDEQKASIHAEREDAVPYQPLSDEDQTSRIPVDLRRCHHVTCRATGCMKWVMRNGDHNEYCPRHRGVSESCDESPKASTPGAETSFIHPEKDLVGKQVLTSKVMIADGKECGFKLNSTCKEAGCLKNGMKYGPKKGYCFKHGGGFTCSQPGCNKQRVLRGLCAAHGGYHVCKSNGCQKRAFTKGYCSRHKSEHFEISDYLQLE